MSREAFDQAIVEGTLPGSLGAAYTRLTPEQKTVFDGQLSATKKAITNYRESQGLPMSELVSQRMLSSALDNLTATAEALGLVPPDPTKPKPVEAPATSFTANAPQGRSAVDPGALPQAERVPQRSSVVSYHEAQSPAAFYGTTKDDPAFGFSPSVPRGGITADFVGRVLSRSDSNLFGNDARLVASAFLGAKLGAGNADQVWDSAFMQGVLREVERRTGEKPQRGDVSFARLPADALRATDVGQLRNSVGSNAQFIGKNLDHEFMASYCD